MIVERFDNISFMDSFLVKKSILHLSDHVQTGFEGCQLVVDLVLVLVLFRLV
jgi:hypothetical protein